MSWVHEWQQSEILGVDNWGSIGKQLGV